ncbi:hypothetical protein R1flu_018513 [Riccia fluitans]|uniref:Uncharacterized protein n=1 Tax=Riccia fluitans TaxID=41844 RepID=A0ABD1ZG23_9MARC
MEPFVVWFTPHELQFWDLHISEAYSSSSLAMADLHDSSTRLPVQDLHAPVEKGRNDTFVHLHRTASADAACCNLEKMKTRSEAVALDSAFPLPPFWRGETGKNDNRENEHSFQRDSTHHGVTPPLNIR